MPAGCNSRQRLTPHPLYSASRLVLVAFVCVVGAQPVHVQVRANGASWHRDPWTLDVESWADLRHAVFNIPGLVNKLGAIDTFWLAGPDGTEVHNWETLLAIPESQRSLTAVPGGRLFQWGPRPLQAPFAVSLADRDGVQLETVSENPRVFLIHNFVSEEEATGLIESALNRTGADALNRSSTGYQKGNKRVANPTRTSSSAFDNQTPLAQKLVQRAFDVTRVSFTEGRRDGLQILRYHEGEAYVSHTDWFDPSSNNKPGRNFNTEDSDGVNRFATVFFYLQSPPTGGFTVFPKADIADGLHDTSSLSTGRDLGAFNKALDVAKSFFNSSSRWEVNLQRDCYSRLAVKPTKLGAVLFYHQDPMTGQLLPAAEHGACPSFTGVKWGANMWIWNGNRPNENAKKVLAYFKNTLDKPADLEYTMDDGEAWWKFTTLASQATAPSNTFSNHWWRLSIDGKEVVRWITPDGWSKEKIEFHADSTNPVEEKNKEGDLNIKREL